MFSKNKNSKDGLQNQCKECNRQYYKENKERINESRVDYIKENREKLNRYGHWHYHTHKDMYKDFYINNREKILEYGSNWRKENPDRMNSHARKYRQKINSLPHTLTDEEWDSTLKEFEHKCAYCGEIADLEKEHFIPVSKDGSYTIGNIIPACRKCNCSKYNRDFFKWYPTYEFYDENRQIHILNYLGYEEEN